MKAGLGTFLSRLTTGPYLWIGISGLLALGVATAVLDLTGVRVQQQSAALIEQQRVVIDTKTGAVLGADRASQSDTQPTTEFDVGEDAAEPTQHAAPEAPAEPVAENEESAAHTPASEPEEDVADSSDTAPELSTSPMVSEIPNVARSKESLVLAPAPEVSETTAKGALPKRGTGANVTPAMIYSRNYVRNEAVATLHFVVLGLGFGSDMLELALTLPPQVSFAFSPYGEALTQQLEAARNSGHEAWIQLPVQSGNYPQDDPGPYGLIASLGSAGIHARLHRMLIAMPGIVGVILPQDESLSGSPKVFSDLLNELNKRGLIAVSTHTGRRVGELSNNPAIHKMLAKADLILDDVPSDAVIKSKLAGLMDDTKKRRQMVVVMHARPQTMILVRDWLKRTNYEGVELAPLSAKLLRPSKMLTPEEAAEAAEAAKAKEAEAKKAAAEKPAEAKSSGGH